jgi:hypothetical protein
MAQRGNERSVRAAGSGSKAGGPDAATTFQSYSISRNICAGFEVEYGSCAVRTWGNLFKAVAGLRF